MYELMGVKTQNSSYPMNETKSTRAAIVSGLNRPENCKKGVEEHERIRSAIASLIVLCQCLLGSRNPIREYSPTYLRFFYV